MTISAAPTIDPAVSISSSMMIADLPRTSPMTPSDSLLLLLPSRRFSTKATDAPIMSAKLRARLGNAGAPRHDDRVDQLHPEDVVAQQRLHGRQLIDGDVEEALDLARVQIDGQHAIGAGSLQHVGD